MGLCTKTKEQLTQMTAELSQKTEELAMNQSEYARLVATKTELENQVLKLTDEQWTQVNARQCNLQKYLRRSKSSDANRIADKLDPIMKNSLEKHRQHSTHKKRLTPGDPLFGTKDTLFRVWAIIVLTESNRPLYSNVIGQLGRDLVGIRNKEDLTTFVLDSLEVCELVEVQKNQYTHLEIGIDVNGDKVNSFVRVQWDPVEMALKPIPNAAGKDIPEMTSFTGIRTCRE
jgi:hypothetical protein